MPGSARTAWRGCVPPISAWSLPILPPRADHDRARHVALPLEFLDRDDAFDLARAALAEVGLSHREAHFPGQFRRRAATGGHRPRADPRRQPTGNLDLATGGEVMDLLFGLKDRTGATLLLITHDRSPRRAMRGAGIVSLADGRIVSAGAKRKVAAVGHHGEAARARRFGLEAAAGLLDRPARAARRRRRPTACSCSASPFASPPWAQSAR